MKLIAYARTPVIEAALSRVLNGSVRKSGREEGLPTPFVDLPHSSRAAGASACRVAKRQQ
jgi:hypothetical protein